jgi:hypothetical protein
MYKSEHEATVNAKFQKRSLLFAIFCADPSQDMPTVRTSVGSAGDSTSSSSSPSPSSFYSFSSSSFSSSSSSSSSSSHHHHCQRLLLVAGNASGIANG